jgi:hypothetical protein
VTGILGRGESKKDKARWSEETDPRRRRGQRGVPHGQKEASGAPQPVRLKKGHARRRRAGESLGPSSPPRPGSREDPLL